MIIDAKRFFTIRKGKAIEQRYEKDLRQISSNVGRMASGTDPNDIESVEDLVDSLKEYSDRINAWSKKTANRMIENLNRQSEQDWEGYSKRLSIGLKKELKEVDIKKELQAYLDDNVKLITSLPLEASEKLHKILQKNLHTGAKRASALSKEIMKMGKVTESRAMLIARTEVSRVSVGLEKVRAEAVQIDWFVWHATHDIRLRKSHKFMDRVLVRWDDPPSPEELSGEKKSYGKYLPGAIFNCRCFPAPLVRVNDVTWPARVYRNGKIQTMNREQFFNIDGNKDYRKAA